MSRAHDQLVNDLLLAFGSRDDMTVWRNFTGTVRAYSQPKKVIKVGLEGSSDILGIIQSPSGRNADFGVFFACEAKVGRDTLREDQEMFRDMIMRRGGLYIVAYKVDDALREVAAWRNARL